MITRLDKIERIVQKGTLLKSVQCNCHQVLEKRRKYLFILPFMIFVLQLEAQIFLKAPEKKTFMYEKEEISYYDSWASQLRIANATVLKKDSLIKEFRFNDLNNAYWNRFVLYYQMATIDPNDILYPFFDGIEFDKDVFCDSYRNIFQFPNGNSNPKTLGNRFTHFKKQLEIMDNVCDCVFKSYNPKLLKILDELKENDQNLRNKFEVLPFAQKKLDSINLTIVMDLYERYGYLNRKLVGVDYEAHMFYIILHSDLETMERFLPIIHKEIEEGRLSSNVYPLLHDRINMIKGLPQEFGTQNIYNPKLKSYELYKTIGKVQVNINRKKYGMKPLE